MFWNLKERMKLDLLHNQLKIVLENSHLFVANFFLCNIYSCRNYTFQQNCHGSANRNYNQRYATFQCRIIHPCPIVVPVQI
jgi:hypothetical protein